MPPTSISVLSAVATVGRVVSSILLESFSGWMPYDVKDLEIRYNQPATTPSQTLYRLEDFS